MKPVSTPLPLVSVVMLAYNHGPYIRKAIEGVLSQEANFAIELLIGEDHSSDNTLEIAREYESANPTKVRVITSDSNVGMKENLRRLESSCQTKYIAYCEGDDYWHDPGKIRKQIHFLEENPQYSLVHTEFMAEFVETKRIILNAARQPRNLDDADAFNEILSGRRLVLTLTACMRAEALRTVLAECPECYDSRFLMCDTQRWLELARRGKVKCLHEVTATHLILSESASQSKNPKRVLRFVLSSKDLLVHYINKYGCPPKIKIAAILRASTGVLAVAYEAGDYNLAKQMMNENRALGLPRKLLPYIYFIGSRSHVLRQIVRPFLNVVLFLIKVMRRATLFLETVRS